MSASITLTFDELPLVTSLGKSSFHLMSVDARISYTSPTDWTVREIRAGINEAPSRFGWEILDRSTPLWHLIAAAIYDTEAEYVEREIRADIRACRMEDA